jgi:hypothetical protein
MVELKWEEPPQQLLGRGRTNWREIADALKSNPEQWAVVAENVSASTGTHIRYGRLKAFEPAGAFEARVSGARADDSGRASKVYARYVGSGATSHVATPTSEPLEFVEKPTVDEESYKNSFVPWSGS